MLSRTLEGPVAATASDGIGRFRRFAWVTLALLVVVILFGAVVRITGSGAGCGQHWPSCNGEVAHLPRTMKTAIEYTHRLTSALSGVPVVALLVMAFRRFGPRHWARRAAVLALVFLIVEALIGAVLVRHGLVENDASVLRAVVMSLHLVNTSALTGALALTAWASQPSPKLVRANSTEGWLLALALGGVLLVSVTGAVTALGDTLYPPSETLSLGAKLAEDQASSSHFLRQLRVVHPVLALTVGALLLYLPFRVAESHVSAAAKRWAAAVFVFTLIQVCAGIVNVWLSAPGWMQVLHLGLANALWVCLVMTWASVAQAYAPN
jgi:heme A synthase